MALASVHYSSASYILGAAFIILGFLLLLFEICLTDHFMLGIILPLFHTMQKSRRPIFRSFRKD